MAEEVQGQDTCDLIRKPQLEVLGLDHVLDDEDSPASRAEDATDYRDVREIVGERDSTVTEDTRMRGAPGSALVDGLGVGTDDSRLDVFHAEFDHVGFDPGTHGDDPLGPLDRAGDAVDLHLPYVLLDRE